MSSSRARRSSARSRRGSPGASAPSAALALYEAFLDDTCALTQGLGARRVLAVAGDVDHPRVQHLAKSQRLHASSRRATAISARAWRARVATHVAARAGRHHRLRFADAAAGAPASGARRAHDARRGHRPVRRRRLLPRSARASPVPELFAGVRWSTPEVLATTLERLARAIARASARVARRRLASEDLARLGASCRRCRRRWRRRPAAC